MTNEHFYTWTRVELLLRTFVECEADYLKQVDTIVAPIRGGLCPAVMLSHMLSGTRVIPLDVGTDSRLYQDWDGLRSDLAKLNNDKTLIVDDIRDSGMTLQVVRTVLPRARCYTLLTRHPAGSLVTYYGELLNHDNWVIFPWEYKAIFGNPDN